jgi:DNA helicase-2/ATP-dependent DNA helicase PcrA
VRLRASEVSGLFFFVYAFARSHYTDSQRNDPSLIDAVHVLTIHKAKGLEFPVIFIPNFEKKKRRRPEEESFVDTSLYDHRKYSGTEEDERRVYYTAITRSEKYLFITGSKEQDHLKSSYEPHQFAENIDLKHFSNNPTLIRKKSGFGPKIRHIGTFPTSFSHLSCYDRCPQDFRLRHVYQYNAGVPVTFGYGTNVHNMLNIVHSDYIRHKRIPSNGEIEKILDRIFKLRYATPAISEPMKKSVLKIVKNYVRLHKKDFKTILETEKKFEFVLSDALISGQIDLLKKVDNDGKVTAVEIIDFKTNKNDSIYQGDYDKQLRFYAIACLESLGLKPEKACVHHLDDDKKEFVDISSSKLEEVKRQIADDIVSIMSTNRQFIAKPDKKVCKECDYSVICPYKETKVKFPSIRR